jgi:hypothetical protein
MCSVDLLGMGNLSFWWGVLEGGGGLGSDRLLQFGRFDLDGSVWLD